MSLPGLTWLTGILFTVFPSNMKRILFLGRSAVLAVDSNGTPITATGNITALTGSVPNRLLDQERAAQKAANQAVQNDDIEDMVKSVPTELVWFPTDTGEAELCWHVSITSTENSLVNRSHFLSAKNGKILADLNLNDYFSEPVSMESEHGAVEITAEKVSEEAGGTYRLYDDSRGIQVLELDAVTQFPSEERRKEISVQSPEEDALLTMKNLELTSDFYQNVLGRSSWDGKGSRSPPLYCPSPLIRPALTAENTWPLRRGEKLPLPEQEPLWIWWLMNLPTVSCLPREPLPNMPPLPSLPTQLTAMPSRKGMRMFWET